MSYRESLWLTSSGHKLSVNNVFLLFIPLFIKIFEMSSSASEPFNDPGKYFESDLWQHGEYSSSSLFDYNYYFEIYGLSNNFFVF